MHLANCSVDKVSKFKNITRKIHLLFNYYQINEKDIMRTNMPFTDVSYLIWA